MINFKSMKGLIEMTPAEIKRSYQQLATGIENFIKYNEGADEAMTLTLEATRTYIENFRLGAKDMRYLRVGGDANKVIETLTDLAVDWEEPDAENIKRANAKHALAKCNHIIEVLQELENE